MSSNPSETLVRKIILNPFCARQCLPQIKNKLWNSYSPNKKTTPKMQLTEETFRFKSSSWQYLRICCQSSCFQYQLTFKKTKKRIERSGMANFKLWFRYNIEQVLNLAIIRGLSVATCKCLSNVSFSNYQMFDSYIIALTIQTDSNQKYTQRLPLNSCHPPPNHWQKVSWLLVWVLVCDF